MKRHWLITGALVSVVSLSALLWKPQDRLIWNRTASAPVGLYWLSDAPFTPGRWVVVSARSAEAQWAEAQGFVGPDWPLIKQVSGLPGDVICRDGTVVLINGAPVAEALDVDSSGRDLPDWQGCLEVGDGEIFLLNAHPRSLDGRYFGVTETRDLEGVAVLLFGWGGQ